MLKRLLSTLLLISLCASLRAADAVTFNAMLDRYYEEYLTLFPIDAAINGDNDSRYEAVWPNELTPDYRGRVVAFCDRYLAELGGFDRAKLSESERLSHDTLRWNLTMRREGDRHFFHLLPVNQFYSAQLTFAQMASGASIHPFKTEQNFLNFLSRAQGFNLWVDTAIANMREGVARGIVPPRVLIERAIAQCDPLITDDPDTNILFAPLKKLPADLGKAEREKLAADYLAGVRSLMIPAYARLQVFLRDEYLPHCRDTAGVGALPGGPAAYAYQVRALTTTDFSPDEIHQTGLREVARIRTEMDKVQAQVGFKGSLKDFLNFIATDPQFAPYKTDEEVLDGYRAIEGRILKQVPKFFRHIPRMKFEIRATEKFRAASAAHEYQPGTTDGSRPGAFNVPILIPQAYRTTRMENLFLHEAIPGHHFQIALAQENTALPRFRRYDINTAYAEGWGLYTESLGRELGLYTDPYQYFGMLLGDMRRAVRLVVDTGLHHQGWTREQTMAFGAENEGGSPEGQAAYMERYMACPGQALAYKIGQLKILALRAEAEKQLGANFDLPAFHDRILMEGGLPLAVLESHVRVWIEAGGK